MLGDHFPNNSDPNVSKGEHEEAKEKCNSTPGENDENPHQSRDSAWRIDGELWRIGGEIAGFEPPAYPIEALGPLASVAFPIAEGGQIDPAMAGQSVLDVAALLAQSRANVLTLAGIKPLSLYLLTIGESGDGKTTAEDAARTPVRNYQEAQSLRYRDALKEWDTSWSERKRKEPKTDKPREPYLVMRDGTVEGIRRGFDEGLASQGVYTSEASDNAIRMGHEP